MKRIILCLIIIASIFCMAACNKEPAQEISTTLPTTAPTTETVPVNPDSKYDSFVAAYEEYKATDNNAKTIDTIVFEDNDWCYIIASEGRVNYFFKESTDSSAKLYQANEISLYYCPDRDNVMVQAMQNAWDVYAQECTENRDPVYDIQLYIFECSYFAGYYGIDLDNNLVRDLVPHGVNCGQYGAFNIFVPENADQSQPGIMTDGEIMVQIQNAYASFVTEMALNLKDFDTIDAYVFENSGKFYRIENGLEVVDQLTVGELATENIFQGWSVYHMVKAEDTSPSISDIQNVYAAFVADAALNDLTYSPITAYIYFNSNGYFVIDEWNNVIEVTTEDMGISCGKYEDIEIYVNQNTDQLHTMDEAKAAVINAYAAFKADQEAAGITDCPEITDYIYERNGVYFTYLDDVLSITADSAAESKASAAPYDGVTIYNQLVNE